MPREKDKKKKKRATATNTLLKKVYLLWFVQERDGFEDIECLIGVYAGARDARAAIERVKNQPGFADHQEGFEICPYELGKDHWTKGFKEPDFRLSSSVSPW